MLGKKWISCIVIIVSIVIGITGCHTNGKMQVEKISVSNQPAVVTLEGHISPLVSINIIPNISGKIVTKPLIKGQLVKQGECIVKVDDTSYKKQLALSQQMGTSQQLVAAHKVTIKEKEEQDKWYRLYKEGIISRVEYDSLTQHMKTSNVTTSSTSTALQEAMKNAQFMVQNATIIAPVSGCITMVAKNPTMAVAGQVLAMVQQTSPLLVSVAIPEQYISVLRKAQQTGNLTIHIISDIGMMEEGKLTYIPAAKDPLTGLFVGKILCNNSKQIFRSGEVCKIKLITNQLTPQITVPKMAIRTKDSGDFVYIVNKKGIVDVRSVLTGEGIGGRVIILSGLKKGDTIVVNPSATLQIGMRIT